MELNMATYDFYWHRGLLFMYFQSKLFKELSTLLASYKGAAASFILSQVFRLNLSLKPWQQTSSAEFAF